ncbi:unnamed protein product [Meganyctiphanes norvegica]|uniref:CUB domain-containing protein n=1 Tax=Meganyctiphanes norvegica TaxID=48144 RepID=A0AAV2Q5V7_MEGNR
MLKCYTKPLSRINMNSIKANNPKVITIIVITILICAVTCHNAQDDIYDQTSKDIHKIYSPIQKSFIYPTLNSSDTYYMHYGQSLQEDHVISFNDVDPYQENDRDERFVSPFSVVRFSNSECTSDTNNLKGTCYTAWDCLTGVSGEADVNMDLYSCARGFGICCTSVLGCGGVSNNNCTWLRSPGYPSTVNSAFDCEQTITIEEDICQLRLTIDDLSLNYPDNTGTCTSDYLTVSQDNKFDKLCGVTKDNHFYLDVMHSMSNRVTFNFHLDFTSTFDRSWSIKVAKICCHSDEEVPRGCGQYYTGTSGIIKSLNHEAPSSNDYVLSGLNYAACVRMENGYCKATYDEPQHDDGWTTECNDIFERPGRTDAQLALINDNGDPKCRIGGTTNIEEPYAYSYLSPHMFKLDTTIDTTNTHLNSDAANNGGNYYITYEQTKC